MEKVAYPLSEVYGLLEPGPVVLLSTAGRERPNIMTLSWHMMVEFEPPLVACVVSNRDYTFEFLLSSGECVINIPTAELSEQVVGCGNTSGQEIDKFGHFRLTPAPSSAVKAPLITECYANLECRVADRTLVEKYGIFILEVLKAWIAPGVKNPQTLHHRGKGTFMVARETIKLASKMK